MSSWLRILPSCLPRAGRVFFSKLISGSAAEHSSALIGKPAALALPGLDGPNVIRATISARGGLSWSMFLLRGARVSHRAPC